MLKKNNDPALFDTLLTVQDIHDRETIYNGMKDVINYSLRPFYTNYEHVDNFYWAIQVKNARSTEPPAREMIPYKLIRDGICRSNKDFNLTNNTGDQRLLNLYPEKTGNFYPTSNICKAFTNFSQKKTTLLELMGMNPWNINIRTERFQKYSPYILFILINIYMRKTLPLQI